MLLGVGAKTRKFEQLEDWFNRVHSQLAKLGKMYSIIWLTVHQEKAVQYHFVPHPSKYYLISEIVAAIVLYASLSKQLNNKLNLSNYNVYA